MALINTFSELCAELKALCQLCDELLMTVVEDKPRRGDSVLVERLGNAIDDARGVLDGPDGALAAAQKGLQALEGQTDLESARWALTASQRQFNRLLDKFSAEMYSYHHLTALDRLGRERSDEWRAWAGVVGNTLDRCQQSVYRVCQALFQCWQEIAERSGTSVSVHTRNIGQQFLVSDGESTTQRTASQYGA